MRATRSNKRRRVSRKVIDSSSEDEEPKPVEDGAADKAPEEDDGFGGMKWELVAITLDEYNAFLDTIRRSRDPNEKVLRSRITADVLPIIEKRAEQLRQKEARRLRELDNLQKLASAKRSSRLAHKAEARKEQEEVEAAERKRVADLEMAKKEQEKQRRLDDARESRMMTREQRIKDREVKRILQEEELKRLEEDKARIAANEARGSERHIKSEMERRQNELKTMGGDEDEWYFDCSVCGVHGQNLDDGTHSIECERCKVWQHSACHGISEKQAENDNFHFICNTCKRKDQKAKEKIPPLKLNFSSPKMSSSPPAANMQPRNPTGVVPPRQYPSSYTHSSNGVPPSAGRPPSNGNAYGTAANVNGQTARANGLQWQPPHTSPYQRSPYANGSYATSRPPQAPPANPPSRSPPMGTFHHYRPPSSSGQASSPVPRPPYSPPQASNNLPRPYAQSQSPNNLPRLSHSPIQNASSLPRPSYQPPQGPSSTTRPFYSTQGSPSIPRPPYIPPQASINPPMAQVPPSQHLNSPQKVSYPPPQSTAHPSSRPSYPPPQMNGHSSSMPRDASTSFSTSPRSQEPQFAASTPRPSEQPKGFANLLNATPGQSGAMAPHSTYQPGLSPAKHESPRPSSSHGMSATPILPPVAALSPSMGNAPSMNPPVKKPSPTQLPPIMNVQGGQVPPTQLSPTVVPPSEKPAFSQPIPQPPSMLSNPNPSSNGHQ